ncbi:hypothetical protein IWQ62_001100 [Dispira parvispora]|uniref:Uncharacterized protein n=1 Tax=Dispira parvispora TaxID=1520584 RepID=A0A9W8AT40_9FUNG|nr:hypothetical protein IWQ62_001100 [Dispira parvispora]
MPNKRRRNANKPKENGDAPPRESKVNDVPKKFRTLMQWTGPKSQKAKNRPNAHNATVKKQNPRASLSKPATSIKATTEGPRTHQSPTTATPSTQAKESKPESSDPPKRRRKDKKIKEPEGKDFYDLVDTVRFNEVVQAPPTLNIVPRPMRKVIMPGETKPTLIQDLPKPNSSVKNDLLLLSELTEEDRALLKVKTKAKSKIRSMSAAEKRSLDRERERIISTYRTRKALREAQRPSLT